MAAKNLSAKVNTIKHSIPSIQQLSDDVCLLSSSAVDFETNVAGHEIMPIDIIESRSRRNNLIFRGFADAEFESWAISKKIILDAYTEHLHITPSEIGRSHHLGRFSTAKKQPIIIKFTKYKLKECILSQSNGFKDSSFSVNQDSSGPVRFAFKKLVEHDCSLNTTFKLRFDKLLVGNKCFIYRVFQEKQTRIPLKNPRNAQKKY